MAIRTPLSYCRMTGCLLLAILITTLSDAEETRADQRAWTTSTFLDFVDGTLTDGGANSYVAADGSIRLTNLRDLNNDGHIDVVFPHTHDHNEIQDLRIFWSEDGYAPERHSALPTNGGTKTAATDLNDDGWPELIVVNRFNGTKSELNAYVYWGSQQGFTVENRTELPTMGAEAVAAGDLNQDGYPELVFANSGLSYHVAVDSFQKSFIYWGSATGYSADNRTTLDTIHATDVKLADLNNDSALDIVFANQGNGNADGGARIYWGDGQGKYSLDRMTQIPGIGCSALEVADLDGDGRAEIVLANAFRVEGRIAGIYNIVDAVGVDSFVYWGADAGYSSEHRTELPTHSPQGVAAEDLNRDGQMDLVFANGSAGASYIYWGSAHGFRRHRRSALPTLSASDCAIGDLNRDGNADIVFSQANDAASHHTHSIIYWGSRSGFSVERQTELPTIGASHVTLADLNRDGQSELVFSQRADGTVGGKLNSWIYWGDENGQFSTDRRMSLPADGPNHCAAADLNHDGYVDLCFPGNRTLVYWGSSQGFATDNQSVVTSKSAFSTTVADFNRDGYLDLVASEWSPGVDDMNLYYGGPSGYSATNRFLFRIPSGDRLNWPFAADLDKNGWLELIVPTWEGIVLYWNEPQGFDNQRKTVLPAAETIMVEVADLNSDGHLDIIVGNLFDTKTVKGKVRSFGGTAEADTFVYWGSEAGYAAERRLVLPSVGNADIAAADLNNDGHLDLVLSSYHAGYTRSHPSYIYWNSADGFDPGRVTMLPTNSASGVMVLDFNQDGHRDILFACHSKNGNHRTDSFLYWGGPNGFSAQQRSLLPTLGAHLLMTVDAGNIYDRGERYEYVSPPFDAGEGSRLQGISWRGDTPFRTRLDFQIRTADTQEQLPDAVWTGPNGSHSDFTISGDRLPETPREHRWVQYKASLVSPDSVNTPVLRSVTIEYSVKP